MTKIDIFEELDKIWYAQQGKVPTPAKVKRKKHKGRKKREKL